MNNNSTLSFCHQFHFYLYMFWHKLKSGIIFKCPGSLFCQSLASTVRPQPTGAVRDDVGEYLSSIPELAMPHWANLWSAKRTISMAEAELVGGNFGASNDRGFSFPDPDWSLCQG